MKSITYKKFGILFGAATAIGFGIEGINLDRAITASQELESKIDVAPQAEIDQAQFEYNNSIIFFSKA